MSLIDKETLQCQICGFQRNKIEVLIPHLGTAHDKVEEFLPLQFHLPRSKAGKYSSTSNPDSPVELHQTTVEQTVEDNRDTGTCVKFHLEEEEEEIPEMDPDSQDCQQPEDPIYIEYLQLTETPQPALQNQNEETASQENSSQAFMDEDDLSDIRNIFDSDDDYDEWK